MRAVSSLYLRALAGSGSTTVRIRPCNPTVRDGSGYIAPSSGVGALPVIGGDLVLDGTADLRMRTEGLMLAPYWPDSGQDRPLSASGRFASGRIGTSPAATVRPGQSVWPIDGRAPLTPYGKLLLVELGVELGGGNVEYARAGYVRVDTMDQDDEPDGPISVETSDLSAFLMDSGLPYERSYAAGTTMQAIFEDLVVSYGWRGTPSGFLTSDLDLDAAFAADTLGAARTTEYDRFAFLASLVADRGRVMWWDGRGKLVVRPPADPMVPVVDIGGPNALATPLTRSGRRITREGVANVVIGTQSGIVNTTPARYVAFHNPGATLSPVDVFPFGFVTEQFSSPLMTSADAVAKASTTRLANRVGLPDQRRARHTVNGAIEPGDIARVWPRGSSDLAGFTLREVSTTRIPLVPGGDQVTTFRDVRMA